MFVIALGLIFTALAWFIVGYAIARRETALAWIWGVCGVANTLLDILARLK